jgi:iduronate 2-sulfatase
VELYDYQEDPLETRNMAAEQINVVAQMRAILSAQPEAKPQIARPKADRAALFTRKDKSGDGKLTREEFLAGATGP